MYLSRIIGENNRLVSAPPPTRLENHGSATALATATAACNSTLKHNLRTLTRSNINKQISLMTTFMPIFHRWINVIDKAGYLSAVFLKLINVFFNITDISIFQFKMMYLHPQEVKLGKHVDNVDLVQN